MVDFLAIRDDPITELWEAPLVPQFAGSEPHLGTLTIGRRPDLFQPFAMAKAPKIEKIAPKMPM
jgi:hypothetical protein